MLDGRLRSALFCTLRKGVDMDTVLYVFKHEEWLPVRYAVHVVAARSTHSTFS